MSPSCHNANESLLEKRAFWRPCLHCSVHFDHAKLMLLKMISYYIITVFACTHVTAIHYDIINATWHTCYTSIIAKDFYVLAYVCGVRLHLTHHHTSQTLQLIYIGDHNRHTHTGNKLGCTYTVLSCFIKNMLCWYHSLYLIMYSLSPYSSHIHRSKWLEQ